MKLIDRGPTHVVIAERVVAEWSTFARSTAHPLVDDARIRVCLDGPTPRVLDFTGWAIRLSRTPADPGRPKRMLSIGTRPRRVLPELRTAIFTARGRRVRARIAESRRGYVPGTDGASTGTDG